MNIKYQNIGLLILSSPIILMLVIGGVCVAYDNIMLSSLENALNSNVQASQSVQKACTDSYNALVAYKQENKLEVSGNGNPCPLN